MIVGNDQTVCFDVDDTLIIWDDLSYKEQIETQSRVVITDPYDGLKTSHVVHQRHINFLMRMKSRGYTVVVWSSSGAAWAAAAVKALGIESSVDICISKPSKIVDDLKNTNEIIPEPMFLNIEGFSR